MAHALRHSNRLIQRRYGTTGLGASGFLHDEVIPVARWDFRTDADQLTSPDGWQDRSPVFGQGSSDDISPLSQTLPSSVPAFDGDHVVFSADFFEGMPIQGSDFTYIVKFLSTSAATQVIIGSSTELTQFIALVGGSLRYMSSQGISRDSPLAYDNTGPHTIAVRKSGNSVKVYNGGVEIGSFTDTGSVNLDWLGDRIQVSTLPFVGNMYFAEVYDRAISEYQIEHVSQWGPRAFKPEPRL